MAKEPDMGQVEDVRDCRDLEAIRQLKARYCRLLDTKDWAAWRALFTDDFVSDTSAAGGKLIRGADDFVAFTRKSLRSQPTVHQVHAPEIELTSATTARGVWALEDVVRLAPGVNMRGYGHYTETYEKTADGWRIKTSTLTRLREDFFNGLVSVYVSDRIRKVLARIAERVDA
jgi:ketosteroid isomerase-like protein